MNTQHIRNGYILVLTLIIMSLLTIVVTQMYYIGSSFSSFATLAHKREQAKILALDGVYLACGQLHMSAPKDDKTPKQVPTAQKTPGQPPEDPIKLLLQKILPVLNTWQTVVFKTPQDRMDGTLQLYITCEEGKIHLNDLLTLITDSNLSKEKRAFVVRLFGKIADLSGAHADLYKGAQEYFEQRKHVWLNDISELLNVPAFSVFNEKLFVAPPVGKTQKHEIFLTDLFTPQSSCGKLDPWVFSVSVKEVLGIGASSETKIQEGLKAALVNFKKNYSWPADWNILFKPAYGVEFASLGKEVSAYLTTSFDPVAFCVASYATVGTVTQGVYALLLKKKQPDQSVTFAPIKFYWI